MAVGGSKLGPEGYTDLNRDQGKSGSATWGKERDEHRLGGSRTGKAQGIMFQSRQEEARSVRA